MFFDKFFERYFKNRWVRINLQSLVVGLLIGSILNIFFTILRNSWNPERILVTYVISYMITMSISNMITFSFSIMNKNFKGKWTLPLVFYFALCIGMLVGTELTLYLLSLIYHRPYEIFAHVDDLKFNLFIALVVGTIVYINGMQKDKYELELKEKEIKLIKLNELKTNAELQALQSKINPHFLYNALNSITSLIHDKPDLAEEMTIKLSKLFRYSLNSKEENLSNIKEELDIVKLYLDIEKIRFQDKLFIQIDVANNLLDQKIPRFLIQPLIENAIKHGISKLAGSGEIILKCKIEEENIVISIHDNGPQFPEHYQAGYGLQSTFDKLNLLYANNFEVQINNGTYKEILIKFPLNHEV